MAAVAVLAAALVPGIASSGALSRRTIVVYVVLLAAVLATPALLGPLGRVAGLPFARVLRLEERLARAAIARDPGRTTITVGALVVGLAMVVALGVVAVNARTAATAWLDEVVPGDEILTAIAPAPVGTEGYESEIAAIDGVARVTPMATFDLSFEGTRLPAVAIRGADLDADGRLTFLAGDRATALGAIDTGGSVILPVAVARGMGVGVGDVIVVATAAGPVELAVAGVVERSFPGAAGEAALVGWGTRSIGSVCWVPTRSSFVTRPAARPRTWPLSTIWPGSWRSRPRRSPGSRGRSVTRWTACSGCSTCWPSQLSSSRASASPTRCRWTAGSAAASWASCGRPG